MLIQKPVQKPADISKFASDLYGQIIMEGFHATTAKYIVAQAAHETGDFRSYIFIENNNLFGMKLPSQRFTLAIGENRGHAVFKTLSDSIADYRIYYTGRKFPETWSNIEAFVTALKAKGYFEADLNEYIKGTKFWYNKYFG